MGFFYENIYSIYIFIIIKVHKTIETHVTVTNGSPTKSPLNQLDRNFPRPPSQSGKRPPSRGHVRSNSTSKVFFALFFNQTTHRRYFFKRI